MWSTVTAIRASTLGCLNAEANALGNRGEAGECGPRVVGVGVGSDDRRVVIGAEEPLEPVVLGQPGKSHPVVPGDSVLALDHQAHAHQTATSSGSVTGAWQAKRSQT